MNYDPFFDEYANGSSFLAVPRIKQSDGSSEEKEGRKVITGAIGPARVGIRRKTANRSFERTKDTNGI